MWIVTEKNGKKKIVLNDEEKALRKEQIEVMASQVAARMSEFWDADLLKAQQPRIRAEVRKSYDLKIRELAYRLALEGEGV